MTDASICVADTIVFNSDLAASRIFGSSGSNVTLLFTGARAAADYLSGRLRQNIQQFSLDENIAANVVHVLIGNAIDFYLHDPTNIAHYSGAVSIQPKVLY